MTRLVDIEYIRNALGITGTAETCKGCRYDNGYELCATHLAPSFAYVCEVLDDAPTVDAGPKWIPCSERLPDDDRSKVVTLANGNVEAGYYSNGDWWCIGDSISLENPTVIAWMPLPEPYEVDK